MMSEKSIKAIEEMGAWVIGIEGVMLFVALIAADCWVAAAFIGGAAVAAVAVLCCVLAVE